MKHPACLILALLICWAACPRALAQNGAGDAGLDAGLDGGWTEGWQEGGWRAEAGISLGLRHHTNLELRPRENHARTVYTVRPALSLRRDVGGFSYVSLEYQALVAATDRSNLFTEDFSGENWWSHAIHSHVRLGRLGGAWLDLDHHFQRTTDRDGSPDNHYRLGLKTSRRVNHLSLSPAWDPAPGHHLQAMLAYGNREYDAQECDLQNQRELLAGATYSRELGRGISWFGQYLYTVRDYLDQNPGEQEDYFRHELFAGLAWAPGGRLSGRIKVGGAWQAYYEAVNKNGHAYAPVFTPVASAGLALRPGRLVRLNLDFGRSLAEAPFGGEGYSYAEVNQGGTHLSFRPDPGLEFFGDFSWELWDFNPLGDTSSLRELYWRAGGGLAFHIAPGISLCGSWLMSQRESDRKDREFQDHIYSVSLRWRL